MHILSFFIYFYKKTMFKRIAMRFILISYNKSKQWTLKKFNNQIYLSSIYTKHYISTYGLSILFLYKNNFKYFQKKFDSFLKWNQTFFYYRFEYLDKNCFVLSCFGLLKISSGVPCSAITP